MKLVAKNQHYLHALKHAKSNLQKGILSTCDDSLIQTLAEIVHNVLSGNLELDEQLLKKLKRFKSKLRLIHATLKSTKCPKKRRKLFINQRGGFWPILLEAALSGLASYGGEKLLKYGTDAVKKLL